MSCQSTTSTRGALCQLMVLVKVSRGSSLKATLCLTSPEISALNLSDFSKVMHNVSNSAQN